MFWAQTTSPAGGLEIPSIRNFRQVDETLLRGGAPDSANIRALAAEGVTTIVDLRAEENIKVDEALLDRLGVQRISIPIRDGQTPTDEDVARFFSIMKNSDGKVYVHCGAGVGRTGSMVGAYLVSKGIDADEALKRNLSVGPPSLEQIAYVTSLEAGEYQQPNAVISAVSRILDGPRRISKYF